jgi:hypothetical protein
MRRRDLAGAHMNVFLGCVANASIKATLRNVLSVHMTAILRCLAPIPASTPLRDLPGVHMDVYLGCVANASI